MNLGHLWICLVGIAPSNNPGTKREILPYMVGNSPCIALYGHLGYGIQFQGMGILFNYHCHRSELI